MMLEKITALAFGSSDATIETIVAGVRRSRSHRLAEERLAELRAKRHDLFERFRAVVSGPEADQKAADIKAMVTEEKALDREIQACRLELVPLRAEFAARLDAAAAPWRAAAARELLDMVLALSERIDRYNDGAALVRRGGGNAPSLRNDIASLAATIESDIAVSFQDGETAPANAVRN